VETLPVTDIVLAKIHALGLQQSMDQAIMLGRGNHYQTVHNYHISGAREICWDAKIIVHFA
jgi:hypothetical protein